QQPRGVQQGGAVRLDERAESRFVAHWALLWSGCSDRDEVGTPRGSRASVPCAEFAAPVTGWRAGRPDAKVVGVTSSDVWDADMAERYDESSAFMFAPDVLDPAVAFLAELVGDGPALEFAIGTGRVAIPLAERGIPVAGIELSRPMADQLRRKNAGIPVVVG